MAVYTRISAAELDCFMAGFDIGSALACEPIAEGIENSNYLLSTVSDRYILTLFEARVAAADLPFYLGLMGHLAGRGIACPVPVPDRAGATVHVLAGRPAAIVSFLDGDWPRQPDVGDCRQAGAALAQLHAAGASYPAGRANDLSVGAWRHLFEPLRDRADELRPGFADWIEGELASVEATWPRDLPSGIVHADLFPDNVFFRDGTLSGMIDFYFACTDFYAYDLAIALNAWCFEAAGSFHADRATALVAGYASQRPLQAMERTALPILARGAALRFLLTRLHDWFLDSGNALTRRKDPLDLVPVIEFHRNAGDSAAYRINYAP